MILDYSNPGMKVQGATSVITIFQTRCARWLGNTVLVLSKSPWTPIRDTSPADYRPRGQASVEIVLRVSESLLSITLYEIA